MFYRALDINEKIWGELTDEKEENFAVFREGVVNGIHSHVQVVDVVVGLLLAMFAQ